MECSICTNAVDESTSSTRLTCGHTFHFGCLATWATTAQTCPMCRHTFGETESITQLSHDESHWHGPLPSYIGGVGGTGRTGLFDVLLRPAVESSRMLTLSNMATMYMNRRAPIRQMLTTRYQNRPIEQYTGEIPDPIDIELVMTQAQVGRNTAERYLAYHGGDVVETVMCFLQYGNDMPIPDFQARERPPLDEPYVSRDIHNRVGMTARTLEMHDDRGYESA